MADVLEYRYKARPWIMLGAMTFFGACAVGMGYAAITNDRGLILNGIFEFSIEGATIFYWCVASVSILFVIAAIFALIAGMSNPMLVRLTPIDFSAPKHAFAKKPPVLKVSDITQISIQSIQKQRFIYIYTETENLNIAESMLPSSEAFEELHNSLLSKVKIRGGG